MAPAGSRLARAINESGAVNSENSLFQSRLCLRLEKETGCSLVDGGGDWDSGSLANVGEGRGYVKLFGPGGLEFGHPDISPGGRENIKVLLRNFCQSFRYPFHLLISWHFSSYTQNALSQLSFSPITCAVTLIRF